MAASTSSLRHNTWRPATGANPVKNEDVTSGMLGQLCSQARL